MALNWPRSIPRTPAEDRRSSPYRASSSWKGGRSWAQLAGELEDAIERIGRAAGTGASLLELSTGHEPMHLGAGGYPLARAAKPSDPGVVVVFALGDQRIDVPADAFHEAQDNARAVWYYLDAMARSLRDGVGDARSAFAGYAALPASSTAAVSTTEHLAVQEYWRRVDEGKDPKQAYRACAHLAHPDKGGSNEAMAALNEAHAQQEARTA